MLVYKSAIPLELAEYITTIDQLKNPKGYHDYSKKTDGLQ